MTLLSLSLSLSRGDCFDPQSNECPSPFPVKDASALQVYEPGASEFVSVDFDAPHRLPGTTPAWQPVRPLVQKQK